jgi:hypothetical protein
VELDEGDASANPRVEYASEDCDDDVWSLSPHSKEFLDDRWFKVKGTRDSWVKSEGKANADSKSSSIGEGWD